MGEIGRGPTERGNGGKTHVHRVIVVLAEMAHKLSILEEGRGDVMECKPCRGWQIVGTLIELWAEYVTRGSQPEWCST